jgi:hypothetical protein
MPSDLESKAAPGVKLQHADDPDSTNGPAGTPAGRKRLFWGTAAVGLGLVAQLALTAGQPLLGIVGLASAGVLFVANMRPYLLKAPASRWDRFQAPPQAGETEPHAGPSEAQPQPPAGTTDLRGRVVYVRHNWRELTLAEIVSGTMPSLPRDGVSDAAASPPTAAGPADGDPAGSDPGDSSRDALAGEE